MRAYNFSAGPATLPESVLRQAAEEMLDWRGLGASVVEVSHRGAEFVAMAAEVEADLRALLAVPDDYAVLFTAGGATTLQALLPLNLASPGQAACYALTGHWGKTAIKQAKPYVSVHVAADGEAGGYRDIPPPSGWSIAPGAAYLHVTANETIHGVEFRDMEPVFARLARSDASGVPLVADFSSSIASEPIDVSRYGAIYGGAQKNLGPVGISFLAIRRDLLAREGQPRAPIFDYRAQANADSMLNTPPSWNWYVLGLTVKWMLDEGGVAEFARRNARKAALLYAAIDGSDGYYRNEVAPAARSRMNDPFFLHEPAQEAPILTEAKQAGLVALKGHRVLGGMRASLYNAMPEAGVQALVDFMQEFQARHG
jgi:phosphoserine aminotransferase